MGYSIGTTGAKFLIPVKNFPAAIEKIGQGLASAMEYHGFQYEVDEDGLDVTGYDYGNAGDYWDFLEALAPFVEPGSYLEWEGEDSGRWRLDFDGTTMTQTDGHTAFHPVIHDWDLLVETVRDGLNADSGDAEREALAHVGEVLGLKMNDDGQYE